MVGVAHVGQGEELIRPLEPAVLLVNPQARSADSGVDGAVRALAEHGVAVAEARAVRQPGRLPLLARAAAQSGARLVIVGGGDGTVSAAASAVLGTRAVLGILPLGTGNDFARSLGIPLDLEGACRVLRFGRPLRVDVGKANGRLFLNAVCMGVSVASSKRMSPGLKRALGALAYPVAATRPSVARSFRVALQADDHERVELRALQVVVGNGRYQGGGRLIAPNASHRSAHLDVYVLAAGKEKTLGNLVTLARFAARLRVGKHLEDARVIHLQARRVRLESSRPIRASRDGELDLRSPLLAEVVPRALTVLAPMRH